VGLDVHKGTIVAEWSVARGQVHRLKLKHTEDEIQDLVKVVGTGPVWAVYEASGCGFVLYDTLTQLGWQVSVVAPTGLKRSTKGKKRKTDWEDAKALRELLLAHGELGAELPAVWVPDAETRRNREVTRRRLALGERLSGVKAGIRSLLQMHGVAVPAAVKNLWTAKGQAWLRGLAKGATPLGAGAATGLASLLRELEFLEKEAEQMQEAVEELARVARYAAPVARMRKVKGVGVLTAMVYMLEMGDPGRFRNRRQVGAYLGLVPSCHESGAADDRKGHITRLGPPRVRKVLNQAAWTCLRSNPALKRWYERTRQRRGTKRALVGVMRRLGILLWRQAVGAA
jgi:transposase